MWKYTPQYEYHHSINTHWWMTLIFCVHLHFMSACWMSSSATGVLGLWNLWRSVQLNHCQLPSVKRKSMNDCHCSSVRIVNLLLSLQQLNDVFMLFLPWMLLLPWLSDPWSWSTYSYTTWTFSPFSSLSAWHANPPATEISRKLIYLELHKYLYMHMFSTHQYSLQIKATCQDDHGVRLV